MLRADYHSHTRYSDGKGTMEDTIIEARKKGLKVVGFSDHAWGHAFYGYKKEDLPKMREEFDRLKEKYSDMTLIFGVEANILTPDGDVDLTVEEMELFDLVLCGYHFGSRLKNLSSLKMHVINFIHKWTGLFKNKAIEMNTRALVRAMERYPFKVLTHPGDKGIVDIETVALASVRTNKLLEINERHHHLTTEQLKKIKHIPVRFLMSSDAHRPEHIGVVTKATERAKEASIEPERIINVKELL
ncbi:PHP domain-containing protein [Guggenheimella bovis]